MAFGAYKNLRGVIASIFVLFSLLLISGQARSDTVSPDAQTKAECIYNLSQFTDWPVNSFTNNSAPLVIGVLGKDNLGAYLDKAVQNETANHRALIVERFKRVEDIKNCQILFIGDSEAKKLPAILAKLAGRGILTVSDMNNFGIRGGMVWLEVVGDSVQLQINFGVLKAAGLTMSSKLLRSAEIVSTKTK